MPIINMDTADQPVFNTFTKSYPIRHVAHASRTRDKKTLCGRQIYKRSKVKFDADISGSCQKCIQRMKIERRTHPGWTG